MSTARTPPAQWLRTFLSVAHHGSLSEAAKQLHLTQAAVSKHVRLLEHSYGVSLFRRHPRGVELSEAGLALRPKVEQAFELLAQAGDALQRDHRRQRVRLRCDATWAEAVLAGRLGEFCAAHPHIHLIISCYIWNHESSPVDADLSIDFGDGELPGHDCQRLSTDYSYMVCSPSLKQQIDSGAVALSAVPRLILSEQEPLWQRWQHASALDADGPRLVCDTSIVCKQAACHGQGLSLQRHALVQHELAEGRLLRFDDIRLDYNESYYVHKPASHTLNSAEQAVWDWLLALHLRET